MTKFERTPLSHRQLCAIASETALIAAAGPQRTDIIVMISGGFSAAYKQLVPQFEKMTGHKVETAYGPSMGDTPQAIPNRLERGEPTP